jgi:hypothetical protein
VLERLDVAGNAVSDSPAGPLAADPSGNRLLFALS